MTTRSPGHVAWVVANAGKSYRWTATGASITSTGGRAGVTAGGVNAITFTAGRVGSATLKCAEAADDGTAAVSATATVAVVAAPARPYITARSPVTAGAQWLAASVTARAGMAYRWSIAGGSITQEGITFGSTNTVTYTAGDEGILTLSCVAVNAAGTASAAATRNVTVVAAPAAPAIVAPAFVLAASAGNTASVTARTGMRYRWALAGGTVTSSGGASGVTVNGTNEITFTAGPPGTATVTCTEINAANAASAPASASIAVTPAPAAPVITAPTAAVANGAGLVAWVAAREGMAYRWAVSGGTLTSPGGESGATSGGSNAITFTAGPSGAVSLSCVEVDAAGAESAPGTAVVAITAPAGRGHLYAVAHQDDDTIFFDPAISDSIRAGTPTRVVWVIAGSSGDGVEMWLAREHQARGALALAAGVASSWTCGYRTYLGSKQVWTCMLDGVPALSAQFIRIPDGACASLWATTTGAPFYTFPAAQLATADGTTAYTRAGLVGTLAAIIAESAPARITTMDSTLAYGDDHPDHAASALFTLEAARTWGAAHQMQIHRGYSVDLSVWDYAVPLPEAANLSAAELADKERVMFGAYGLLCSSGVFSTWCARHYAVTRVAGGTGPLVEPGGLCVDSVTAQDGARAVLAPCSGAASQGWRVLPAGALARADGAGCLSVGTAGTVQLAGCTGSAGQAWMLFSNGQLRGPNGSCLGIGADGASLEAQGCLADRTADRFGPPVEQQFTQRFTGVPASGVFADAEVGASQDCAATFRAGDIDGDGRADACIRLADGLHCAPGLSAGVFGPARLVSAAFSDSSGWLPDPYGSTWQLVDIDGDGRADACARGSTGITCALAGAAFGTFGAALRWSSGTDFSDAAGSGASAGLYRSLAFADVDGDGRNDACIRTGTGVACALNTGLGTLAPAAAWTTGEFTDAAGWGNESWGATLRLADITGDGRADVCGRWSGGLRCAVSSGTAFVRAHLWSFREDFSDAAGWGGRRSAWGSIALGDVDGDGRADACGRAPSGVVCALSTGVTFDAARVVAPDFSDLSGWQPDRCGAAAALVDLDRDGRSDVCLRGAAGVTCSLAP